MSNVKKFSWNLDKKKFSKMQYTFPNSILVTKYSNSFTEIKFSKHKKNLSFWFKFMSMSIEASS